MDLTESVTDKISTMMNRVYGRFDRYAPKSELTGANYKKLTEDKLIVYRQKYGDGTVYDWIKRNQEIDNAR